MSEHEQFVAMIRVQVAALGRPGERGALKRELIDDVGQLVVRWRGHEPSWINDLRDQVEAGAL